MGGVDGAGSAGVTGEDGDSDGVDDGSAARSGWSGAFMADTCVFSTEAAPGLMSLLSDAATESEVAPTRR
ncbi:hypothetical protein JCM9533A_54430 [Catenuloplanes niger JCM 9533]|uniref:Uncharacterized protein n=1 Tax=Catenuloplanes niger TaxID=587534 RepID=A0AAE3ZRU2_9ACTN|nr:hypothetical protein [Catenuloplanes niger]